MLRVSEPERVSATSTEPRVTPPVPVDVDAGEVDLEKDAEMTRKTSEPTEEQGPEAEKTDPYNRYVLSGKGDMPEQKVNEAVKDLNYHNILVMIVVRDKTINNVGSIHTVAEKWGLSYSIVQRAISGVKELNRKVGNTTRSLVYPKEGLDTERMNHNLRTNQIRKPHLPRNLKLAEERAQRRSPKRRPRPKDLRKVTVTMKSYPMCYSENARSGRDGLIPM